MKKLIALIIVLVMAVTMFGCSVDKEEIILEKVEEISAELTTSLEAMLASKKTPATVAAIADVDGIVLDITFNEIEAAEKSDKSKVDGTYKGLQNQILALLGMVNEDCPEITYFFFTFRENDGDVFGYQKMYLTECAEAELASFAASKASKVVETIKTLASVEKVTLRSEGLGMVVDIMEVDTAELDNKATKRLKDFYEAYAEHLLQQLREEHPEIENLKINIFDTEGQSFYSKTVK